MSAHLRQVWAKLAGKTLTVYRGMTVVVPMGIGPSFPTLRTSDGFLDALVNRTFTDTLGWPARFEGHGVGVWWSSDRNVAVEYSEVDSGVDSYGDAWVGVILTGEVDESDVTYVGGGRGYTAESPYVLNPGAAVTVTRVEATVPDGPKKGRGWVMRDLGPTRRKVASAPSIDKIVRLIVEGGTVDLVRSLWDFDYSAGDLATDLDYEVEPLDSQFPELRQRFQAISQDRLRSMGLGPTLTVFRAGAVYPNMPMPTTLNHRTAETHRNFRGRDGSITEYEISLSDVLYYSEATHPRGTFAEEEIGVMGRDMRVIQ